MPQLQQPEFSAKLSGTGAIAMTFPHDRLGTVEFQDDVGGALSIKAQQGLATMNLRKLAGRSQQVQLPEGGYEITLKTVDKIGLYHGQVAAQSKNLLATNDFIWVTPTAATPKGETPSVVRRRWDLWGGYGEHNGVAGISLAKADAAARLGWGADGALGVNFDAKDYFGQLGVFTRATLVRERLSFDLGFGVAQAHKSRQSQPTAVQVTSSSSSAGIDPVSGQIITEMNIDKAFHPDAYMRLHVDLGQALGVFLSWHTLFSQISDNQLLLGMAFKDLFR